MSILADLRSRFAAALATLAEGDVVAPLAEMVLPSQDVEFGDYQANCAMPLGKKLKKPPREVAQQLVDALDLAPMCEPPEIAGPGFINLRLRDEWLVERLQQAVDDTERLGVEPVDAPRRFVVDFSSPNVAKPMHVGHIRSTVIGDAICRVLRFLGHDTISDNHIGDWGTQFGMIIYGYKHFVDNSSLAEDTVAELSRLYKLVNQLVEYHQTKNTALGELDGKIAEAEAKAAELAAEAEAADEKHRKKAGKKARQAQGQLGDLRAERESLLAKIARVDDDADLASKAAAHPNIGEAVLAETSALHAGDATNRGLWEQFLPACLEEIDKTYQRLNVTFDHALGESFYEDKLAGVVEDLQEKGIATVSDGAVCVFVDGIDAPFIVRKRDGAFLYATTDLATIRYRLQEWKPDAILYVVDHRQSLHFRQLFATAALWGCEGVELEHISFGTVLGEDNKPYKTRSGSAVGLMGLLDEAVQRAYDIAAASPVLTTEDERRDVAEKIGIGAIKYADLSHNRTSDYVFSYDKMLAMNGNTAAYMQNSYARVRGIFEKAGVAAEEVRRSGAAVLLASPAERALAISLMRFSEALDRVADDYRPNFLAAYLFDLASSYSDFYEKCPVVKAETDGLRRSRLLLCDLTARTIGKGLELLGIQTVERM